MSTSFDVQAATANGNAASGALRGRRALPRFFTGFVGRDAEIAALSVLLEREDVRLVTLTGAGGIGKTRLSVEVAEALADRFPDGVWFVPLSTISDADHVPLAIAQVLGIRESGVRSVAEDLIGLMWKWNALVILDNFEHVLDASPAIVDLLSGCPEIKILCTSRSLLHVSGELDFPVALLRTESPGADGDQQEAEAVELFLARALAVRPDFDTGEANRHIIREICEELDGLPLAIELASARVRYLPLAAILSWLRSDRPARFQLLAGGPRDAPDRHRSLRDTIAWSYGLLEREEQALFRRLSVFAGGFSLASAETICTWWEQKERLAAHPDSEVLEGTLPKNLDVFGGIFSLVDKSLLLQRDLSEGEPWFQMLATVREFAREELVEKGEAEAARWAHALHYLALAEEAAAGLRGPEQREWIDRLNIEYPNLQAALVWFDEERAASEMNRMVWALFFYWWYRGLARESMNWFDRALEHHLPDDDPTAAWATFGAALLACNVGNYTLGSERAEVAHGRGVNASCRAVQAMALTVRSYAQLALEQPDLARQLALEALELLESGVEDSFWFATGLAETGLYLAGSGDYDKGIRLVERALKLDIERGDDYLVGVRLSDLGVLTHTLGKQDRALTYYADSIDALMRAGGEWYLASPLAGIAALTATHDPVSACHLVGAAESLRERGCAPSWATERDRDEKTRATLQSALGEDQFELQVAVGRGTPLDQIASLVASLAHDLAMSTVPAVAGDKATLSPREMDVLRLLAAGQSDRGIGETLFISPRTASKHVANILAKLGVATRAEAAVYAVRHDLI